VNIEESTVSTEHPNAQVLREFFDAFGTADRDRLAKLVTEDLVWHFPGSSPISGDWLGLDGLLDGVRATAMALGGGKNGFELLHVYADDTSAVTVHRDYYTGDDNHLDLRYVLHVRMVDGRMAEVWEIPFDQAENDRYMAVQAGNFTRGAGAA
jgi:uncharacterized protein